MGKLNAPRNLYAIPSNNAVASINVYWDEVDGASSYKIYYEVDGVSNILISDDVHKTILSLQTDTDYIIKIQALSEIEEDSDYSQTLTIKTGVGGELDAPSIDEKTITDSSIYVKWSEIGSATGYKVYYKKHTTEYQIETVSEPEITLSGLDSDTPIEIKIQAVGDGTILDSPETVVSFTTNPIPVVEPTQLETPEFTSVTLTNGIAVIEWDSVDGADAYEIAYSRTGGSYETVEQNIPPLTIQNLEEDVGYYFKIKALGDTINYTDSEYSSPIFVMGVVEDTDSEYSSPIFVRGVIEDIPTQNDPNQDNSTQDDANSQSNNDDTTNNVDDNCLDLRNTTNKSQWPDDLRGYSIGKDGYFVVSFDQGETYYEIDTARDVTVNFSTTTVDTSCRRSGMYKENLPIVNELTIDAEMLFDLKDNVCNKLVNASQSNGIFLLGAFTDSGNGPLFYGCATDMSRPEELEGVVRLSAKYSLTRFITWFPGATSCLAIVTQTETQNGKEYRHPFGLLEIDHSKLIVDNSSAGAGTNP